MAPTQLTLGSRGPFNPNWRLQGDQFQRDIVYRCPIFRRRGILRYVTRVAAFPQRRQKFTEWAHEPLAEKLFKAG